MPVARPRRPRGGRRGRRRRRRRRRRLRIRATGSLPRLASGSARRVGSGGSPGDRVQRQPQPGRRVAREQHEPPAAEPPVGARPADRPRGVSGSTQAAGRRRLLEPGQQACAAIGGVVGQIVVGGDGFARRAGAPRRRAGAADPRRRAAPGQRAGRGPSAMRAEQLRPASGVARCVGRHRRPTGRRAARRCVHSGSPSVRQCSAICQRGNGSPGYHLPWPRCTRPCGAQTFLSRAASAEASSRLCGPSASVFHSGST